jgi:hypothetical protein
LNPTATTNVTVTGNLLAGGGFTVYGPQGRPGAGPSKNVVVTGNEFSARFFPNGGYFGAVSYWENGIGNRWSNNTWADGNRRGTAQAPAS